MKRVNEEGCVLLDSDWLHHLDACMQCRGFDKTKPATAACLCLEGSVLWKRDNAKPKRKALPGERDAHRATREEVRRVTRYRE